MKKRSKNYFSIEDLQYLKELEKKILKTKGK